MSIEIRHMVVNAIIQNQDDSPQARQGNNFDSDQFRVEVMEACSDLIRRYYQQQQER